MFNNSPNIEIHKLPRTHRKYLIMIRAGSKPRPSMFNKELPDHRNYDLAINYYSDPHAEDALAKHAEIIFSGGLSKMHGAKLFLERTKLHEVYGGILFLDDDLEILFDPEAFFAICEEHGLDIAQPSVTDDSSVYLAITKHHPALLLRTTNWVEVMAPFFRKKFLKEMIHSFDLSISGWGLDIYWGHHLGEIWKAGIIDACQMRHSNPVDLAGGPFYEYLKTMDIDPAHEMKKILSSIGIKEYVVRPINFIYYHYTFN